MKPSKVLSICSTQESLRDAQVNLRKHIQENESLEFRNQQLSKRVALLQEDVNSPSKNKKKKVRQTLDFQHVCIDSLLSLDYRVGQTVQLLKFMLRN